MEITVAFVNLKQNKYVHITDCVIILDLLQGLADHLKSLDLENQNKLMLLKYKLLNTKIDQENVSEAYKTVAKAFQDGEYIFKTVTWPSLTPHAKLTLP